MDDNTIKFHVQDEEQQQMKEILKSVYAALQQKGYNPINRLSAIFFLKTRRISPITITPAA